MPKDSSYRSLSLRLIRWLCRPELYEEIEGNLLEYRQFNRSSSHRFKWFRYWFQVFNYFRPSTLKRFNHSKRNNMFIFNPLLTIRQLIKQGGSTVINILGFTLSLVCVIFLYFYLKSELSYDNFHADKDQIYRAIRIGQINGSPYDIGVTSGPYASALLTDFPNSVKAVCRALPTNGLISFEDQTFAEQNIVMADSNFFSFFSYPLAVGQPEQVLKEMNTAVISQETAKKYFGDENPIGKTIKLDQRFDFIVTGILGELPAPSHLDFDLVLNVSVYYQLGFFSNWWSNAFMTYSKIETPAEAKLVGSQLDDFMEKYMGDNFAATGTKMGLKLEPLSDVYFNRETRYDRVTHGNKATVRILALVGLAILFIASFNYVNLAIAQSIRRAKEVSVRKVLGSGKGRLVLQLLGESLVILLFSCLAAIGISILLKPSFTQFFELDFPFTWQDPNVVLFFAGLITVVLVISGLYPARLLTKFSPNIVLRGGKPPREKNTFIRKGLVAAQFVISIFMIAATLLISQQMKFIQNKDLGFDKEAVLVLRMNNRNIQQNAVAFKNSLANQTSILSVSTISGEPGGFHDATTIRLKGREDNQRVRIALVDAGYFETFRIDMLTGRPFSDSLESDVNQTAILNESAVKALNMSAEEVVNKEIDLTSWGFDNIRIIGVVEDYNFSSLKDQIEPLVIVNAPARGRIAVKVNIQNLTGAMDALNASWEQFSPGSPMQYEFLDDTIERLYINEAKQNRLFTIFSGISIFLACMGIFGLVTHAARQRQKELGIRKVLGASVGQIIGLISKEFIILISIGAILAIPIAWYFIGEWLNDFAYQISIPDNWPLFVISGVLVGLIAFITIGLKTYRAAVSNPTESIRYE